MKTVTRPCIFTLFLISCLLALQPVSVRAAGVALPPALYLLLLSADSHADNIEEVDVPDDFNWDTTKDITVNISLLSTSSGSEGELYAGSMTINIFRATPDDPTLSLRILQMPTDVNGQLSTIINIPAAATSLKIVALDLSDDPPSTTIQLNGEESFDIDINLNDNGPGDGEGY